MDKTSVETCSAFSSQDSKEADQYFTVCAFIDFWMEDSETVVALLRQKFPEQTQALRAKLNAKSKDTIARLLQEYKVEND